MVVSVEISLFLCHTGGFKSDKKKQSVASPLQNSNKLKTIECEEKTHKIFAQMKKIRVSRQRASIAFNVLMKFILNAQ